MSDDQIEDDIDKVFVSHSLEYYKRQARLQLVPSPGLESEESKEFIIVQRMTTEQMSLISLKQM